MDSIKNPKSTDSKSNLATRHSASYKHFYLICSIVSLIISWAIFAQFLLSSEASVSSFFTQTFATPIATLVSSDVILSALIFLTFTRIEIKRLNMPANRLAIYTLSTFSVGVCFALALFLYQREDWLSR
ncbi:MAG: DUF2834 domain-containing protein [Cyanobacteria bacterium P01_D01_bin.36]